MNPENISIISRAIQFIETHLTEKLDLERVAEGIHYSKYHLHRVFANTVGLTIHDYVQRRQLTEAAKLLVFSEKPIMEIALIAGYETQQSFTTVFTAMYKQPPNQYRENEEFYPLQLRFQLEGKYQMFNRNETDNWRIHFATEDDIPVWMDLVRLVIDGFPHLQEDEYILKLSGYIKNKQALVTKDNHIAVGIMLFSYETGSIDFMGTHPLYHKKGIAKALLDKVMCELIREKELIITTYRKGDKADTGHRKFIQELGFAEGELLTEFGYPTQRFILPREVLHES